MPVHLAKLHLLGPVVISAEPFQYILISIHKWLNTELKTDIHADTYVENDILLDPQRGACIALF